MYFRSEVLIMMPRLTSNSCAQIISQPTKQPGTSGLVFLKIEHTHYTTKNTLLLYISTNIAHDPVENGRWKQWLALVYWVRRKCKTLKLKDRGKNAQPVGIMHGHNTRRWEHSRRTDEDHAYSQKGANARADQPRQKHPKRQKRNKTTLKSKQSYHGRHRTLQEHTLYSTLYLLSLKRLSRLKKSRCVGLRERHPLLLDHYWFVLVIVLNVLPNSLPSS